MQSTLPQSVHDTEVFQAFRDTKKVTSRRNYLPSVRELLYIHIHLWHTRVQQGTTMRRALEHLSQEERLGELGLFRGERTKGI